MASGFVAFDEKRRENSIFREIEMANIVTVGVSAPDVT
jgi:hypothetical protein